MIESRAKVELEDRTKLLVEMVSSADKELRSRTSVLARGFQSSLAGKLSIDPVTVEIGGKPTPTLSLDGRSLNLEFALVDRFTAATGAVAPGARPGCRRRSANTDRAGGPSLPRRRA